MCQYVVKIVNILYIVKIFAIQYYIVICHNLVNQTLLGQYAEASQKNCNSIYIA